MWNHAGGRGPLAVFWRAVRELDTAAQDESGRAGVREGHLARLFGRVGVRVTHATAFTVQVKHATFEEWWEPFTLGVGPGRGLRGHPRRGALRGAARALPSAAGSRSGSHQRDRVGGDADGAGRCRALPLVPVWQLVPGLG